ncbi:hypothetical protein [Massilia haematophila]|uniref:Uncharacterized protein n=1 Tax=Massilia haematophila TaxID=457923 RepID=A0ABV7PCW0_9BURK
MNFESVELYGSMASYGRLMAPSEVQEAIYQRKGIPSLHPGWCLCGDVKASMFDAIIEHGNGVDIRLSGFVGPADGAFATITQQLGGAQHRYLLPLYEPCVVEFLEALERQPIQTMLGREGQTQAIVLQNKLSWRNIAPLVEMCQQNRRVGVEETLAEVIEAIHAVSRPETIPSVYKGVSLTDLSVSVIVPMQHCLTVARDENVAPGEQE